MTETPLTPETIRAITRALLLRDPWPAEELAWMQFGTEQQLATALRTTGEFVLHANSADHYTQNYLTFRGYSPDAVSLLHQVAPVLPGPDAAQEGFVVDFLGCRTRVEYVPQVAHLSGAVQGYPIPNDWHSDLAEWLPLIRSVMAARDAYRIMELGMGWAPWLVAGGELARRRGIRHIRLHGIEADAQHFEWARMHLADNGFDPDAHNLRLGAVGVRPGSTYFSCAWGSPADYGARPLPEDLQEYRGLGLGVVQRVPVVPLREMLAAEDAWEFVHMDVQGGEAEICAGSMDALDARVALILVSTHSRLLDGQVMEAFWRAGWALEGERPSRLDTTLPSPTLEAMTTSDGQQCWRNPKLLPSL